MGKLDEEVLPNKCSAVTGSDAFLRVVNPFKGPDAVALATSQVRALRFQAL